MNKEQMVVNAIRILSAEAVQKAKSGHPGMPMGAAGMAYAVWGKNMVHNPKDPKARRTISRMETALERQQTPCPTCLGSV